MGRLTHLLGLKPTQPTVEQQPVQPMLQPQTEQSQNAGGQNGAIPHTNTYNTANQRRESGSYIPYGLNSVYPNGDKKAEIPTDAEVARNVPLDIPTQDLYNPENQKTASQHYVQKELAKQNDVSQQQLQQNVATQRRGPALPNADETPEQAYQRAINQPSGPPSQAQIRASQSKKELRDYLEELGQRVKPSKEQEKRDTKRAKQRALFAAIGDGLSALSNLYFTTKGAPNAYNPNASLSKANLDRWNRMKEQREKDVAKYMNILKERYGMDAQDIASELASEKAREEKGQNAATRAAKSIELKLRGIEVDTKKKAAKDKADNDARNTEIRQQQADDTKAYHQGSLAVQQHRANTAAAVGASTIAKNNAATEKYRSETSGGDKPDKQGRKYRFIYVPMDGKPNNKSKKFRVLKVYGTEDEANNEAKKYPGAYVPQTSHSTNGGFSSGPNTVTRGGGYRYIPTSSQNAGSSYYDESGNQIVFDNKRKTWVNKNTTYTPAPNNPFQTN